MATKTEEEEIPRTTFLDAFPSDSEDQLTRERGKCLETDCTVRKFYLELKSCNERVYRKIRYTAENCHQEMVDLMEALDYCSRVRGAFIKLR